MCKPALSFTFSGDCSSPPRGLAPACGGVVLSGGCVNHSGFEAFLAIELDVLSKTPNMSRASRIHEDHLLAGLVRLWAYAFREKRAELHQDEVRGCFATEESVLPVLVTFGFIDPSPDVKGDCFRVRGAEKYLRISAARSAGGKASAGNLKRGTQPGTSRASAGDQPGSPPEETLTPVSDPRLLPGSLPAPPNTEHRTPNTREEEPPPRPVERGPLVYHPPDTPPGSGWKVEEFFRWFQVCRQTAGLVGEKWPRLNLSHWWAEVLGTPGMSVERLCLGEAVFGQSEHWRGRGLPFGAFAAQWRDFVPAVRGAS